MDVRAWFRPTSKVVLGVTSGIKKVVVDEETDAETGGGEVGIVVVGVDGVGGGLVAELLMEEVVVVMMMMAVV